MRLYLFITIITFSPSDCFSQQFTMSIKNGLYSEEMNDDGSKSYVHIAPPIRITQINASDSVTINLSFDEPDQSFFLVNDSLLFTKFYHSTQIGDSTFEIKTPPSTFSLFVPYEGENHQYILKDNLMITTDSIIHIHKSDAHMKITFNPLDEVGNSLKTISVAGSSYHFKIGSRFGFGRSYHGMGLDPGFLMVSDIEEGASSFVGSYAYYWGNTNPKLVKILFPRITSLHSDTTLTNIPSDFVSQNIEVNFPANSSSRNVLLYDCDSPSSYLPDVSFTLLNTYSTTSNKWYAQLIFNGLFYDNYTGSLNVEQRYDMISPYMSYFSLQAFKNSAGDLTAGGFAGRIPSPNVYLSATGDTLIYGKGLIFGSNLHLNNLYGNNILNIASHFFESTGRKRTIDDHYSLVTIVNSKNETIYSGGLLDFDTMSVVPDKYRTTITNSNYFVDELNGQVELLTDSDFTEDDVNPPVLTSLQVLNTNGKLRQSFSDSEKVTIKFSIADIALKDSIAYDILQKFVVYKAIVDDSTKLLIKDSNSSEWEELELEMMTEDTRLKYDISTSTLYLALDPIYFLPAGIVYKATLDSSQTKNLGNVDLQIQAVDQDGNTMQCTIKPAFVTEKKTTSISSTNYINMDFRLYKNYPNPFNPKTVITYRLAQNSDVKLVVYDIIGRKVITLVNENQNAGTHSVHFDGSNLASGVYYYKIFTSSGFSKSRKMLLLR